MSAQLKRVVYLDGWRGFAILAVLVGHFGTTSLINLGRFGVELFFVLSGRLMAEILFTRKVPLTSFFPRRFSRVYPALFAFSTLLFLASAWLKHDPSLAQYLSAITFTVNYSQFWIGQSPNLDHIWSLCIEEHMYILLGLIALSSRRLAVPVLPLLSFLAALAMTIGVVQTVYGMDYYQVYWRTDVRGASLLMGAIAYLYLNENRRGIFAWTWAPVLFGGAAFLLHLNVMPDPVKYTLGTTFLAFALVLMPKAPSFVTAILEHPLSVRFGLWSYSIYLWQQPFFKLGGEFPTRMVHLAGAMLAALISFYCVEKPARRALNAAIERWQERRQTGEQAA